MNKLIFFLVLKKVRTKYHLIRRLTFGVAVHSGLAFKKVASEKEMREKKFCVPTKKSSGSGGAAAACDGDGASFSLLLLLLLLLLLPTLVPLIVQL